MRTQLSKREVILASLVGSAVFLLVNVVVINFFLKNRARLQAELLTKASQLQKGKSRLANKPMWMERDEWLKKVQPKLENDGTAGGDLLNEIREAAKKTNVQVIEPQIGTVGRQPQYASVFVTIDAKTSKEGLRDFLYEMQSPERSVVFESANLQFDKNDKTQMYGKFRIAKWFAPK